jgi:hypothetical protein
MTLTLLSSLTLMGFDFCAEIEIEVLDWGTPPTGLYGPPEFYDPGASPDYAIESLTLQTDDCYALGAKFEATGELLRVLSNHFASEILQTIEASEPEDLSRSEYDEDYYRDER